jgi:hypothetical protein
MAQYDPKKHHRQSTRLKGFDYGASTDMQRINGFR